MSRDHLNVILEHLVGFAQVALAKHGEFFPFAAVMTPSGEVRAVAADVGSERPLSQEVVDALTAALTRQALDGEVIATGICLDVRTIPPGSETKTDAICARLEHSDGEAVDVYLPYRKRLLGGYRYGEIFAGVGEGGIFGK